MVKNEFGLLALSTSVLHFKLSLLRIEFFSKLVKLGLVVCNSLVTISFSVLELSLDAFQLLRSLLILLRERSSFGQRILRMKLMLFL
mmetsp:Transcript_19129/g.13722  ORF Transcript_19129/g.13722 Transcript_19129/m.13722 type:complete len:87 (-) Transcript_19129:4308-4568(-)